MRQGIKAAAAYFAIVFSLGFVLGTARVLVIAPRIGEIAAVLLEAPIMLTCSWFAARWCIARFAVGSAASDRLVMGFAAFGLVMGAELALAVLLFGQTVAQHFGAYQRFAGGLGLGVQLVFALVPFLQRRRR